VAPAAPYGRRTVVWGGRVPPICAGAAYSQSAGYLPCLQPLRLALTSVFQASAVTRSLGANFAAGASRPKAQLPALARAQDPGSSLRGQPIDSCAVSCSPVRAISSLLLTVRLSAGHAREAVVPSATRLRTTECCTRAAHAAARTRRSCPQALGSCQSGRDTAMPSRRKKKNELRTTHARHA